MSVCVASFIQEAGEGVGTQRVRRWEEGGMKVRDKRFEADRHQHAFALQTESPRV